MKCPECGKDINDNDVFCGSCGAEILINSEVADEVGTKAGETAAAEIVPKKKSSSKNKGEKNDRKKKLIIAARILGIIAVIAIIVIIIVCVAISIQASAGRKIFDSLPLGRDIDIIESQTGTAFVSGENSVYGALNHIADYDYICESEKSVNVGGVELPEWAVLLTKNDGDTVGEARLYNFYVIKHNWMGSKTAGNIEMSAVKYGDSLKKAEGTLGLKPYTIIKESTENTSVYVYRYHYTDDETGNTVVKNFYVTISDVDGKVKDVSDEQLDYLKLILQVE